MKLLTTVTKSVKFEIEIDLRLIYILKLPKVKIKPISVTNKWLIGVKLSFSYFSVFIDADLQTRTLEQKLCRSGDANQTYLWASHYALRCPCVYWCHILLHMQHWNRFYTHYIKQNLHLSEISEWIVEFHIISLFLWRTRLWIVRQLFLNVVIFFMVPVLLGNNQKIGFKWKQNLMPSGRYGHGAENPKDISRFKYRISINYMSFGTF